MKEMQMNKRFSPSFEEKELLDMCSAELEKELENLPLESTDLDTYICSRSEILDAIRTAPNRTTRQLLFADYRFREWLEMMVPTNF